MLKKHVFRIMQPDFATLERLFQAAGLRETQAYALCSLSEGPYTRSFLVNKLLIPGPSDLEDQSGACVVPTAEYQAFAYGLAQDLGLSVIDVHNHPFSTVPHLSAIDFHHGTANAKFLVTHLQARSTMGMVVFGESMQAFDGRIWDRANDQFDKIDRLEVVGSPLIILTDTWQDRTAEQDPYARQRIIPGWQQGHLERLNVFVAGLGGNGAPVLASLVAVGIGRQGWIKACDPDKVEASNLPRIPYALPTDVGRSKAKVAQDYARKKGPDIPVDCYEKNLESKEMLLLAKEANLLIGAGDNDGVRKILNSLAIRYLIPYLDMGAEIIPDESSYQALGQVLTVLPGQSGCLMCSGLIDPNEAALDLLSEEDKAARADRGYVRGTDVTPTPSVSPLNGIISNLAMSQLIRLVYGENAEPSAFLQYDGRNYQLLTATLQRNPQCPVCGEDGYLGEGDELSGPGDATATSGTMFQLSQGSRIDKDSEELSEMDASDGDTHDIIRKDKKPSPDDSRCYPGGEGKTGKENQK